MPPRTIAIGDIHGCSAALSALIEAIQPGPDDLLVFLGDYVDRGPDTRGVIEQILALSGRCAVVTLFGNHEQMLLDSLDDPFVRLDWFEFGGAETCDSYGGLSKIPAKHLEFVRSCVSYCETSSHIFVHASYNPDLPMDQQDEVELRWASIRDALPAPHVSGKVVIVGHTSQKDGVILDAGHLKCIDTFCFGGGWLTALDVRTGQIWQADAQGKLRDGPPDVRVVTP